MYNYTHNLFILLKCLDSIYYNIFSNLPSFLRSPPCVNISWWTNNSRVLLTTGQPNWPAQEIHCTFLRWPNTTTVYQPVLTCIWTCIFTDIQFREGQTIHLMQLNMGKSSHKWLKFLKWHSYLVSVILILIWSQY